MDKQKLRWVIIDRKKKLKSIDDVIDILLENRGLITKNQKDEFFNPARPDKITLKDLGLKTSELAKIVKRIKQAIADKEEIIIYGDYDADGVCATAILWECLYAYTSKVSPYLPDRFSEGYGINSKSIESLKAKNPNLKLLITVDNGIVANDAIDKANSLGLDVIVSDHHQKGSKFPNAYAIFHTDKIAGSGISWILSRELNKELKFRDKSQQKSANLELAALGTIADQLPLIGPNRSIVKYGLIELRRTKRPGFLALFRQAAIKTENIGTYEVNFVIAPRLNAMGRMVHSIDSLRLLCTTNPNRAQELAEKLGNTNKERQEVVSGVVRHAQDLVKMKEGAGVIVLAHESYHEGVIGLAAGRLVEEYYRPAIVLSRGVEISKASARSISGFNIIDALRKVEDLLEGVGGHPMAAGFSIKTKNILAFEEKFAKVSKSLLSDEVLRKVLKVDMELDFKLINNEFISRLKDFEPFGLGNPKPVFLTENVEFVSTKLVGAEGRHLKAVVKSNGKSIDAIGFGLGGRMAEVIRKQFPDIVYNVEENVWNGNTSLQLNIKDITVK